MLDNLPKACFEGHACGGETQLKTAHLNSYLLESKRTFRADLHRTILRLQQLLAISS